MSFVSTLIELFTDTTLRTVVIGTMVLGASSGMLGCFAMLRNESLLGDAISHASLPGIVLAFIFTKSKESYVLLLGAFIIGLLGFYWIRNIKHNTKLKTDTALGLVLSLFFGFGMLLLTFVQKIPNANQAGLDKYLFGQAATLVSSDVNLMIVVSTIALIVLFVFWKEFKLMLFDKDYMKTLGFNIRFIDILISFFIILIIVLGLQTVGVVLMSSLLLAPAAAARQWTNSLGKMFFLASIFGAISGVLGTAISANEDNLATGPLIVIVASVIVFLSFLFSPIRGILFRKFKIYKNKNNLESIRTLKVMFNLAKTHENFAHPHSIGILNDFKGISKSSLEEMVKKDWIKVSGNQWNLTNKGFHQAQKMFLKKENRDD